MDTFQDSLNCKFGINKFQIGEYKSVLCILARVNVYEAVKSSLLQGEHFDMS